MLSDDLILIAISFITLTILIITLLKSRKKKEPSAIASPPTPKKEYSTYQKNISYHGNYIDIDSLDFFGKFNKSPNEIYTVAYSESPSNKYVLLKGENILVKGDIDRPSLASVANNGTFIINNWGISTNLYGLFTSFTNNGDIIIKEKLKANLCNNSISADGSYAICQTYKSKHEEDSNKLLFFDLIERKLLWKINSLTGIAESYNFNLDEKILTLHYSNNRSYRYSFEGRLLDEEEWKQENNEELDDDLDNDLDDDHLEITDPSQLFERLEETHKEDLESLSKEEVSLHLKKLSLLLDFEEITTVKYKHARTYRYLGESYLKLDRKRDALQNFKEALKVSKRVGVKRITKQLEEELSN
jgi:hypothetical protein